MAFVCPHCQRVLQSKASFERHVENCKSNPANTGTQENENPGDTGNPNDTPAELEIEAPAENEQLYQCGGCHKPVTKGQSDCPHCGEALEWAGL